MSPVIIFAIILIGIIIILVGLVMDMMKKTKGKSINRILMYVGLVIALLGTLVGFFAVKGPPKNIYVPTTPVVAYA
jgi:uncharacterized membrane protein